MKSRATLRALPGQAPSSEAGERLQSVRQELARARLLCRAWAETLGPNRSIQAGTFSRLALEEFAAATAPGARLSPHPVQAAKLDHVAAQLARAVGHGAASLPLVEGLHVVSSLYPALLAQGDRSALGAFYTPPTLVGRLLDNASHEGVNWRTARVLDPAAGAGAFLVQAALRMRDAMGDCSPAVTLQSISARLLGFELDANAAGLAQATLEVALGDLTVRSGRAVPSLIRICDTLEQEADEKFDLVTGNPPYGRVTLTPAQRKNYARSLYGHANLYGVFTDAALRWAKPTGIIAFLTPTSFLAGQYYAALRGLLAREAPPTSIDFVHARRGVFEDVLQETLLAVYRKSRPSSRAQIHYLNVINESESAVIKNGTIGLPASPTSPWLAPRDPRHSALIGRVEAMPSRLADWGYSVSTGPLVWNRFKPQLRYSGEGKSVHPLVWAESVTSDGRFIFRAEKRNHAPFFKLCPGDDWLLVDAPCVLVQRTTAKEQVRRLIAAELPATFIARHRGVVVENHLNMVRARDGAKVPPGVVAALLNSQALDEVFRCMNGSVAVSAFELESLPLPDSGELTKLKRLVARRAARSEIEAECTRLYGGAH